MLDDIKRALEELGYKAYYGRSLAKPNDDWNYFVFNKSRTSRAGTINIIKYILFVKIT